MNGEQIAALVAQVHDAGRYRRARAQRDGKPVALTLSLQQLPAVTPRGQYAPSPLRERGGGGLVPSQTVTPLYLSELPTGVLS